ncbi:hypothetical protein LCGC14_2100930, partial [marine sediment metagenome]
MDYDNCSHYKSPANTDVPFGWCTLYETFC